MQDDNASSTPARAKATLSVIPGVETTVSSEGGRDYLQMRAAQLSALNHLLTSGDFDAWDETIKADAKWLAATLASEVCQLTQFVTFGENLT